jgi:hypothetical protein
MRAATGRKAPRSSQPSSGRLDSSRNGVKADFSLQGFKSRYALTHASAKSDMSYSMVVVSPVLEMMCLRPNTLSTGAGSSMFKCCFAQPRRRFAKTQDLSWRFSNQKLEGKLEHSTPPSLATTSWNLRCQWPPDSGWP